MEVFYEKNIINESIDKHKKRNTIFNVIRIVSIVLLVIEVYFFVVWQPIPFDKGALAVTLCIFASLVLISFPVCVLLIFTRLLKRLNAEYDYYILGDIFRIVRVENRKKRKKMLETPLSAISSIGLVESEAYDKFDIDKTIKKIHAFCNDDALLGYIMLSDDGEKKLVTIELDNEFIVNLKKTVSLSVFDNSIKLLKNKAETQE